MLAALMELPPLETGVQWGAQQPQCLLCREQCEDLSHCKHHQRKFLQKAVLKQSIHSMLGALTGEADLLMHPPWHLVGVERILQLPL